MTRFTKSVCVFGGAVWLSLSLSWAHTLDAPAVVQADVNGTYSYTAVFTASEDTIVGTYGFSDQGNTAPGGLVVDCFCPPEFEGCPVAAMDELEIEVQGNLVDTSSSGSVSVNVILCAGGIFEATTTIEPADPAAIPTVSEWGLIVLTLLLLITGSIVFAPLQSVVAGVGHGAAHSLQWSSRRHFDGRLFLEVLAAAGGLVALGLFSAEVLAGGVTAVDVMGAALCTPLFAYLVYLWVGQRRG